MLSEKVQELERENTALKTQVEMLQNICGSRIELPKNCEYCNNFIQHYIRCGNTYHPVYDGVCAAGNRVKGRKASDTCKSFVRKEYGRNRI